jgi:endoglucanase
VKTIDTVPATMAHILYGACVGGPNAEDEFWDYRGDYDHAEVAVDYTAPILTLSAYEIMAGDRDPYYTSLAEGSYNATPGCPPDYACGSGDNGGGGGLSQAAKIAIGVIVPVVVLIAIGVGVWLWRRRKGGW